ncbi:transmembrane protease serine 11B-like protein [Leguminivora glycinivorella]|uniref:transmembrane protease serine 11B-like protein n=1 Tax=Leguminivora glycinivorella TaxID=1035111 RepID=UPI00200D4683|nr:transmembrane protease serine 11B-like protein [Leguminivora glycinivorella]
MFCFIFLNCLVLISALESRIFNGEISRKGEHGYLVQLNINSIIMCSGSIISERWILSSAHCFSFPVNTINVFQKAGTGINRQIATVSSNSVKIHPDYVHHNHDLTNRENDIALLKTTKAIRFNDKVYAIKVAKRSPSIGQSAVIAGYGDNESKQLLAKNGIVRITRCPFIVKSLLCTFDKVRAGDADSEGSAQFERQTCRSHFCELY